jgi:hypothetical protein
MTIILDIVGPGRLKAFADQLRKATRTASLVIFPLGLPLGMVLLYLVIPPEFDRWNVDVPVVSVLIDVLKYVVSIVLLVYVPTKHAIPVVPPVPATVVFKRGDSVETCTRPRTRC